MNIKKRINPLGLLIEKTTSEVVTQNNIRNGYFTFLNFYSYYIYRKSPEEYCFFSNIYCDGILLQKFLKLANVNTVRQSFDMTSVAPIIFNHVKKNEKKLLVVGSEEKNVQIFVEKIKSAYCIERMEYRNGYFKNDKERDFFLQKILKINPDFIIVGMGTPAQDRFLFELHELGWEGGAYTCGGFIHQVASGKLNYYPEIFNKLNLRWLYRMYDEPKLIKRYFGYYPLSAMLFLWDLLRYKIIK